MIQASTKPDATPDLLTWLAPTPGSASDSDRTPIAGRQETSFNNALDNFRHSLTRREYSSPRHAAANHGSDRPDPGQDAQSTGPRSTPTTAAESGTQPPRDSRDAFEKIPDADKENSAVESQAAIATTTGPRNVESKREVNLASGSFSKEEKAGQDVPAARQAGELFSRPAGSIPRQTPRPVQAGADGAEFAAAETADTTEGDSVLPRAAKVAGKEGEPRGNTGRDGQSRGTDGAKIAQQMQNTAHKGPEPAPRLQPLPGGDRSLPMENPPATILSSGSLHRPTPPLPATQAARPIHPSESLLSAPTHTAVSNAVPVTDLRPAVASSATALDNLQLRIVNGAMEMRAVRAESMSVVLRPDAHTEMVLNLTMQNGLVDVEARMQRGDGGQLAQQWSQLQQSLSQQGIRLHMLQSAPEHAPAFAEHFDQSPSHQEQPAPREQEESAWTPSRDKSPIRIASQPHANLQPADGTFESWA